MDPNFPNCPAKMSYSPRTDYKTATRRNEYIRFVNGPILRDDEYRLMLQTNGVDILRKQFAHQMKHHCPPTSCVHSYPTRVSTSQFADELQTYNRVMKGGAGNPCGDQTPYQASQY